MTLPSLKATWINSPAGCRSAMAFSATKPNGRSRNSAGGTRICGPRLKQAYRGNGPHRCGPFFFRPVSQYSRRSALLQGAHHERDKECNQGNTEEELSKTAGNGRWRAKAENAETDRGDQKQKYPAHGDLPPWRGPNQTISLVEEQPDDDQKRDRNTKQPKQGIAHDLSLDRVLPPHPDAAAD